MYAALSGTLLQSVMSQQYNSLMELYTQISKIYFSWKFSLYFIQFTYMYVRDKIILHAFMIELDQLDY